MRAKAGSAIARSYSNLRPLPNRATVRPRWYRHSRCGSAREHVVEGDPVVKLRQGDIGPDRGEADRIGFAAEDFGDPLGTAAAVQFDVPPIGADKQDLLHGPDLAVSGEFEPAIVH